MIKDFNIFEQKALLQFLKDYLNKDNLSNYEGSILRFLFLAFLKLQLSVDEWEESMSYTE